MHTMFIDTEEHGQVIINHNSDYSGNLIVTWRDLNSGNIKNVELPAAIFVAINRAATRDDLLNEIVGFIENL